MQEAAQTKRPVSILQAAQKTYSKSEKGIISPFKS